jgi:hypothetical protein
MISLSSNKLSTQLIIQILDNYEKLRGRIIYEYFLNSKVLTMVKNKNALYIIDTMAGYLNTSEKFELIFLMLNKLNKDENVYKDYEGLNIIIDKLR